MPSPDKGREAAADPRRRMEAFFDFFKKGKASLQRRNPALTFEFQMFFIGFYRLFLVYLFPKLG